MKPFLWAVARKLFRKWENYRFKIEIWTRDHLFTRRMLYHWSSYIVHWQNLCLVNTNLPVLIPILKLHFCHFITGVHNKCIYSFKLLSAVRSATLLLFVVEKSFSNFLIGFISAPATSWRCFPEIGLSCIFLMTW